MEFREMTFNEAEVIIAGWRNDPAIEEAEPGVEICDCNGDLDVKDAVSGNYETGRYIGGVSGILSECDRCHRKFFATIQNHFMVD